MNSYNIYLFRSAAVFTERRGHHKQQRFIIQYPTEWLHKAAVLFSPKNTLACLSWLAVMVFQPVSSMLSSEACFISSKLWKELAVVSDLHLSHSQVPDGQPRWKKAAGKSSAELRSLWIESSVRGMTRKEKWHTSSNYEWRKQVTRSC